MSTIKQALTHSLKEMVAELDRVGRGDEADDLIETYIDAVRIAQTTMQPFGGTNQIGPSTATSSMPQSASTPIAMPTSKDPATLKRAMQRVQELRAIDRSVRDIKNASNTVIADAENYYAATKDKVQKWRAFLRSQDFKMGLEAFRDQNGFPTMRAAYNAYMSSPQIKQDYAQSSGGGGFQLGASPSPMAGMA
jgi:hypothetical protein